MGEYGGDTDKGREAYVRRIEGDIAEGLEIREKVIGRSILGEDKFIEWVKERILKKVKGKRELPARNLVFPLRINHALSEANVSARNLYYQWLIRPLAPLGRRTSQSRRTRPSGAAHPQRYV